MPPETDERYCARCNHPLDEVLVTTYGATITTTWNPNTSTFEVLSSASDNSVEARCAHCHDDLSAEDLIWFFERAPNL